MKWIQNYNENGDQYEKQIEERHCCVAEKLNGQNKREPNMKGVFVNSNGSGTIFEVIENEL